MNNLWIALYLEASYQEALAKIARFGMVDDPERRSEYLEAVKICHKELPDLYPDPCFYSDDSLVKCCNACSNR